MVMQKFSIFDSMLCACTSTEVDGAGSRVDWTMMKSLLEGALRATSSTGFRDIQKVVHSIVEATPVGATFGLRLHHRHLTRMPGSTYTIAPGEELVADFGSVSDQDWTSVRFMPHVGTENCAIHLPGFTNLPFRMRNYIRTDQSRLVLKLTLSGTASGGQEHHSGTNWLAQSTDIMTGVYESIVPILGQTEYDSLEDLAQGMLALITSQRDAFRHVINVNAARVRARLVGGKNRSQAIVRIARVAHDGQPVKDSSDQSSELPQSPQQHGETEIGSRVGEGSLRESLRTDPNRPINEKTRPVGSAMAEQGNHEAPYAEQTMQITASADSTAGHDRAKDTVQDPKVGGVFIALGSNVGDRLINIEKACREMDAEPEIRIVRTSALYETAPMYVADQDPFLNGVCEASDLNAKVAIAC